MSLNSLHEESKDLCLMSWDGKKKCHANKAHHYQLPRSYLNSASHPELQSCLQASPTYATLYS